MTTTDPFGTPGPATDPFGTPAPGRGHDYADAEARAQVPRDQWDRYLIPGPDGIKPAVNKGRTRVSTTKSVGSDQTRLQAYSERMIMRGLAMDAHLNAEAMRAQAMEPDSKEQKRAFAKISAAAYERAGGNDRRDRGTELHELLDAVTKDPATTVPEHLAAEVTAYRQALIDHHLTPVPEYNEAVVICPYDHGGAIDAIMQMWNPDTEMYELVIVDYKTGKTLEWSKLDFLSQLWFYANAYFRFVTESFEQDKDGKVTSVRGYMEPMPVELRTDKVILIHAPLDGSVSVYELDISGWGRVVAAQVELRRANNEAQHKYRLLGTVRPDAYVTQPVGPRMAGSEYPGPIETRQGVVVVPVDQGPLASLPGGTEGWEAFTPTPTAPTPDAAAQEAKAAERTAVAESIGKALSTINDVMSEPTHDPVTGRKKRTCGHCRLPGHTQKNCPDNPASAKYAPRALTEADPGHPVNQDRAAANVERVAAMAAPLLNEDDDVPWCLPGINHTGSVCQWTSQPPAPAGTWGCSITGKPSKQAYEAGTVRITAVGPSYGRPDGEAVAHLNPGVNGAPSAEPIAAPVLAADYADGDDAAPPPALWNKPPDMVAWAIKQAQYGVHVLQIRAAAIADGTWNEAVHEPIGRERYMTVPQTPTP